MAEYFGGGNLRFIEGEWRDDDGEVVEIAEVKHGKWVDIREEGFTLYNATCTACRTRNDIPHPWCAHYCPSCGAKMDCQ